MPLTAVALVLVAAFTHATWNLFAKRAAASRHFVWLYSVGAVILWTPIAAAIACSAGPAFGLPVWGAFAVTGALHMAYSLGLQRAYAVGDLSVVYPVVRGTGPLLSFLGAIALLGERPSAMAALGAAMVIVGVFLIAGGARRIAPGPGLRWGVATGALVAAYTLFDGWAVRELMVLPVLVDYSGNCFRCLFLAPRALRDRQAVLPELRRYGREVLAVAVLGPLGYILVLYALQLAPVSRVAPARELSMLVGALLGARLLSEGHVARRLCAAALIAAGVATLAAG
jgi:drug/metabolite transporter (DMT)-like permease